MSALDEVITDVESAQNAINHARDAVQAAVSEANDSAAELTSLGLDGAAATLHAALSRLEAAYASLTSGYESAERVAGTLRGITDRTSTKQAAERLAAASGMCDQVTSAVDAATESTRQAYEYVQQAEVDSVASMTVHLIDTLTGVRQATEAAKKSAETYRQQIEAASRGN